MCLETGCDEALLMLHKSALDKKERYWTTLFAIWLQSVIFAINMEDDDKDNRIPPSGYSAEDGFRSVLAEASDVSYRTFESIQAVAGTTACKGVQINALRKYAVEEGCWFSDISVLGDFVDRGSENEVYSAFDTEIIYKLNDFRYADDNLNSFFERIQIHNHYFPECKYDLIEFAQNQSGKICAVLTQPFIHADREATSDEISDALMMSGFLPQLGGEYFTNGEYDIFDALPNNVLYGTDGHLYFIDTIIYSTQSGGIQTYRSLSPRFSGNVTS